MTGSPHRPRIDQIDLDLAAFAFRRISQRQAFQRRLADGISAPESGMLARRAAGDEQHPARIGQAQQGIKRTDQAPIGGDIDLHHFLEGLGLQMRQRRQLPQHPGIAQEGVQPAPALEDRGA